MEIKQQPLPPEIAESLPAIRAELIEYLDLEEAASYKLEDLEFKAYLTVDRTAFVIFEYMSDDEPCPAWVQYSISGSWNDGCLVSWGYGPEKTIESMILSYIECNPLEE